MRERINSVDLLRGIVMVIMALDHVRDFFMHPSLQPTDMATTTPWLFFTRWITHFCAPVFVFLAGTGAYLQLIRGKSKRELSIFLFTRGLFLVLMEFTLVRWGWTFSFDYHFMFLQVIWALGVSMIVLSALVHLPLVATAAIGVTMIVAHNAFDAVAVDWSNPLGFMWAILHTGDGLTPAAGYILVPFYPLIPWIGVMAAGYAFGAMYTREREWREQRMMTMGLAMCLAFVAIRAVNIYGDSSLWAPQRDWVYTILSILNCTKYPPSLDYLLMTLGPALIVLARAERWVAWIDNVMITFGRVPMFYYLIHIPVIHLLSIVFELIRGGNASYLSGMIFLNPFPENYGYSLWVVYAVWIGVIVMLYPLCSWYMNLKKKSTNPILRFM